MSDVTKSRYRYCKPAGGLLLGVVIATVFSSCGRGPGIRDERLAGPLYETVWVDPQIIFSDTLLTLIRADRIDSILVTPSELPGRKSASVEIRVVQPACNVSVSLLDLNLEVIHPLMVRNLSQGFYRLTLDFERFSSPVLWPGSYFLRADYCDQLEVSGFRVD